MRSVRERTTWRPQRCSRWAYTSCSAAMKTSRRPPPCRRALAASLSSRSDSASASTNSPSASASGDCACHLPGDRADRRSGIPRSTTRIAAGSSRQRALARASRAMIVLGVASPVTPLPVRRVGRSRGCARARPSASRPWSPRRPCGRARGRAPESSARRMPGNARLLVDVHLGDLEAAVVLGGDLVEHRCDCPHSGHHGAQKSISTGIPRVRAPLSRTESAVIVTGFIDGSPHLARGNIHAIQLRT